MAKLLIQTPITSNGRDVVLDDKGQIRYRDTIVEDNKTVRSTFEKLNKRTVQKKQKLIILLRIKS